MHIGGVILREDIEEHSPAGCSFDVNIQQMKGNASVIGDDSEIAMDNGQQQQQQMTNEKLVQMVSQHCNVNADVAMNALQASNWNPNDAANKIATMISMQPPGLG